MSLDKHSVNNAKPKQSTSFDSQVSNDNLITVTLLQELVRLLKPKPFRKRHPIIFWGFIILLCFILYGIFSPESGSLGDGDRIAVVRVEGVIVDATPTLVWIDKISKMDSVKGVLLRVDSPGGGASPAQEIYSALVELSKKKPLVVSMGSTAASGGLMVAMAGQYVVANPSTITGSIGVRMDVLQIFELLKTLGINQETLTTGKFKDVPSVMKALNPEERAYLQSVLQDLYDQFVQMIATGRKMTLGEVQKIADGRIFTGKEAKNLGLVDALGGQNVALEQLYKLTGLDADTPLYERPEDYKELYAKFLESIFNAFINAQGSKTLFLYQ